jgi:hypothetical protein
VPLHEVRDEALLHRLAEDMRRRGWAERDLLVEPMPDGRYAAWVGSHRWHAAVLAGLAAIPSYVIDTAAMSAAGVKRNASGLFRPGDVDGTVWLLETFDMPALAIAIQERGIGVPYEDEEDAS